MKKKLLLTALAILLCTMFIALFAVTVYAEEAITVTYNWYGEGVRANQAANEDGTYTLRENKISNNATFTFKDGTVVDRIFLGWIDKEGNIYEPGQTVSFTKSTQLYEFYGVEVDTAEELLYAAEKGVQAKMMADITVDTNIKTYWATATVYLNGHTLTSTYNGDGGMFYMYRGGMFLLGPGEVVQDVTPVSNDANYSFARYDFHFYGQNDNPQMCYIGKGVKVTTPYTLARLTQWDNGYSSGYTKLPRLYLSGDITAKSLIRGGYTTNAPCYIYDTAKITLTGAKAFEYTNANGVSFYMDLRLMGGSIQMTDPNGVFFDDLAKAEFSISRVTSGKYAMSAADAEFLKMFLPDELMLKSETDENGVVWYSTTAADCTHDWVLNEESSVEAALGVPGLDIFDCSKCGTTKKVVTVYSPQNVEVVITVKTENGTVEYTALAGEVYDLVLDGFGATATYKLAGLKDTDAFTADQIIGIEIPAGIPTFIGFANQTLEKITVLDGCDIKLSTFKELNAIKEIEIKAAKVEFASISATTLEKIVSNDAGAEIIFKSSCFAGRASLTTLTLSAGSTYTFENNAFKETGLTEVIFPDDSIINFTGDATFYGCPNLKYVYFGRNCIADKKIYRKPFDCAYALETVVLMDIIYIDQYVFCCNGNASSNESYREGKGGYTGPIRVYHHGESISINDNAFVNRTVQGVEFYTTTNTLTALSNCKYTIYNGIGHRYMQGTITESTCVVQGTAGYYTDCVCGNEYRENAYVVINADGQTECEAYGTEIIYLPLSNVHVMGETLADIVYADYFAIGTKYYYCSVCGEATLEEAEPSAEPLFIAAGYSTAEGEKMSVSHTIKVNREAVNAYIAVGHDFHYGAVAAINSDGAPVLGVNLVKKGAIMLDMTNTSFDIISVKINGITQESAGVGLNCCAYAIENSDTPIIKYLCDDATLDRAESVSYSSLTESQPETTVPSDEKE